MKCIHCGKDSNYKVRRASGDCGSCFKKFAFEPRENPFRLTDPFFDRAIQLVSDERTVHFTRRQLWYELNRRLRRRDRSLWNILNRGFNSLSIWFLPVLPFALLLWGYYGFQNLRRHPPGEPRIAYDPGQAYRNFTGFIRDWETAHGQIGMLLPPVNQQLPSLYTTHPSELPPLTNLNTATQSELVGLPGIGRGTVERIIEYRRQGHVFTRPDDLLAFPGIGERTLEVLRPHLIFSQAPEQAGTSPTEGQSQGSHRQREAEPDLTSYSFDRALVTDHADTAAMLVANNFHFENNCAVLSVDGYPEGVADTVLTMLQRNPELKVYALHDASAEGCSLPLSLREERWFPDPAINVIDLGLRPRHAKTMRLFTLIGASQTVPDSLREVLAPEEVIWLEAGHVAEVSVLRPARLIRGIYQGFSRESDLDSEAARDLEREDAYASSGWSYYGGFYGSDSFG